MNGLLTAFDEVHTKYPSYCGRVYAFGMALSNACAVVVVKFVDKRVSFGTVGSLQGAISFALSVALYSRTQQAWPSKPLASTALFIRGFIGGFLGIMFIMAVKLVPAQKNIVLMNTAPIWVVILSIYFLNDYPNKLILAMVASIFLGVILLIYPSLIIPSSWLSSPQVGSDQDIPIYYYIFPLLAGFSGACVTIFLKVFSKDLTVYSNSIAYFIFLAFWMGLASTLFTVDQDSLRPSIKDCLFIFLFGFACVMFQLNLTLATRYEKRMSIVAMIGNSQILIAYVMDYFLLGNRVELINAIGGLIVAGSTITIAFTKESISKPAEPAATPQTVGGETQPHPK